jgi:tetratricopeptide (TPR) repeat protein
VTAAERAVTLDPNASQAYVYLARGRGEIARRSGILQNLNVATELKRLFEKALELNPQDADALVGFGMWHLELVENGVGWLYGGKRDQVMPLVEAGVAAAPDQVNLRVEYATALRAFAQPELALEQLEAALALPARSAVDRAEQERARRLLNN